MKQHELTILGQSYILGCPDGGEASLLAAVATVDTEMSAIRDAGKVKARERIAVLAALNLAYRLAEGAPVALPAAAAAAPRAAAAAAASDAGSVDLDALLRRVDAALQDDGLLL
jgi:cell division protein ZapA